jgi:hypothetical protein
MSVIIHMTCVNTNCPIIITNQISILSTLLIMMNSVIILLHAFIKVGFIVCHVMYYQTEMMMIMKACSM